MIKANGKMMIKDKKSINNTLKFWPKVSKVVSTIHSVEQYKNVVKLLDNLIDDVSKKSDSHKELLIDTLGTLIKDYEDRNIKEPENEPIGTLRFLMEEHRLKQTDLKEIGSQGVVSEILNGKRKLNLNQIVKLSKRFSVSPALFIENNN